MSPTAVRREMRMISKVGRSGVNGRNSPSPTDERFDRNKVQRNSAGDESEDADEERRVHSHRNGHAKGVGSDTDLEGLYIKINLVSHFITSNIQRFILFKIYSFLPIKRLIFNI
jgi:hypothetical protein